MLRGGEAIKRRRRQGTQVAEHLLEARMVDASLDGEVVEGGGGLDALEFDEGMQTAKQVVGLRGWGARGAFGRRGVLLEALVVFFDFPPSLVDRRHLLVVEIGSVAAHQVEHPLGCRPRL